MSLERLRIQVNSSCVIMSALWLKLLTILCLNCAALSYPESSGVLWRDFGGSVTIQCRTSEPDQKILSLKKGLREDDVVAIGEESIINSINTEFKDRLQLNGAFPSMDILITNLTFNDTGPFWCVYTKFDKNFKQVKQQKSKGSVLVVVKDKVNQCEPKSDLNDLILISFVAIVSLLLCVIMSFFLWVIKRKTSHSRVKPRRITTNDVYEDMRGTLRA